jgi:hypothetical protein
LIYLGVAILGKVAGDMIAGDPFVTEKLHPSPVVHYALDAVLIIGVLALGLYAARARRREAK